MASVSNILVKTENEYQEILGNSSSTVIVVDAFAKFAGPCEALLSIVKKWKLDFGEDLAYIQAQTDDIQSLEKYRNKSIPTFLVFSNQILVNIVRGVDSTYLEKTIKDTIQLVKSGEELKQFDEKSLKKESSGLFRRNTLPDIRPVDINPAPAGKEYTLAIVKPDAIKKFSEIKSEIQVNGFEIVHVKRLVFKKSQACEFYKDHQNKIFFTNLVQYMTSGPVIALLLLKENSVDSWRNLLGPTNATRAKDEQPNSLRAKFGTDGLRNGLHGSESVEKAEIEWKFVFSEDVKIIRENKGSPDEHETTLLVIRPEVVGTSTLPTLKIASMTNVAPSRRGSVVNLSSNNLTGASSSGETEDAPLDEILYEILRCGLTVSNAEQLVITKQQVESILGSSVSDEQYSSWNIGNSIVLVLEGYNTFSEIKKLIGPPSYSKAKAEFPDSLSARFGLSEELSGFHYSKSIEKARQEIDLFFPYVTKRRPGTADLMETTFAMIKPDIYGGPRQDELIRKISDSGFVILDRKELVLSEDQVRFLYSEHAAKLYFADLVKFMTRGPVLALVLEKQNAIVDLRDLMGPSDPEKAKEQHPNCIRAFFGTDLISNAIYGSDSLHKARRDIDYFIHFKGLKDDSSAAPNEPAVIDESKDIPSSAPLQKPVSRVASSKASITKASQPALSKSISAVSNSAQVKASTTSVNKTVGVKASTTSINNAKPGVSGVKKSTASINKPAPVSVKASTASLKPSELKKAPSQAVKSSVASLKPSSDLKKTPSQAVKASAASISKTPKIAEK